jgi:hypothetical protein
MVFASSAKGGCDIINLVKEKGELLRPFFWDSDPSKINLDKNSPYIIERILELGDERAVRWLFKTFSLDDIKSTLLKSRRISKKSRNFWCIVLEERTDV